MSSSFKVTKGGIADLLKKKYHLSVKDAKQITEAFFYTIISLSKEDGGVLLKNFGRFEFRKKILAKNIYDFKAKTSSVKRIESAKMHFIPSRNLKGKVF